MKCPPAPPSRRPRGAVTALTGATLLGLGLLAAVPALPAPEALPPRQLASRAALVDSAWLARGEPPAANSIPDLPAASARLPVNLDELLASSSQPASVLPALRLPDSLLRLARTDVSEFARGWPAVPPPRDEALADAGLLDSADDHERSASSSRRFDSEGAPLRGSQHLRLPLPNDSGWSLGLRKLHADDRLGWTTESTSRGSVEQVLAVFTLTVRF